MCRGGSPSFGFGMNLDYDKKQVEFIGVEAGGPAKSKRHAAPLTYGSKIGILHGAVNMDQIAMVRLKKPSQFRWS